MALELVQLPQLRQATVFLCAAFGVFFLPSLSMQPFYYTVLLSGLYIFPSANRDLWWFLHQPTGDSDSCINYWTNGGVPLVGLGQAMSRLPGHRGTRGFIWIFCDFLGSVHVMSFHVHRTQFPSWTVVPVEEKPMKQLSLYCSTSMKTN